MGTIPSLEIPTLIDIMNLKETAEASQMTDQELQKQQQELQKQRIMRRIYRGSADSDRLTIPSCGAFIRTTFRLQR